jgi:hypothetical protein
MSADPFANTTTVKNILNHIISPKIVKDGSGGYTTKTDLVNIDNLIFASRGSGTGSVEAPLTAQCGVVAFTSGQSTVTVYHSRVTANSIIIATHRSLDGDFRRVRTIVPNLTVELGGYFVVTLDGNAGSGTNSLTWFIASF